MTLFKWNYSTNDAVWESNVTAGVLCSLGENTDSAHNGKNECDVQIDDQQIGIKCSIGIKHIRGCQVKMNGVEDGAQWITDFFISIIVVKKCPQNDSF